ncbi:MAG: efflux RND transporter periplasmic adaptor subunit [Burkholderiales bacterium]|nr:efflux RND transporter periplasmic adaptor subunit [Burkholderiales bacterium]
MFRHTTLLILCALTLTACNKIPEKSDKAATSERPLLLSAEDIVTVQSSALVSGPSITGSVQPERRADLRAEVSAVVLQVLKENGDSVRQGDVLVRLDDTAIRDSLVSAEASARAANQAYDQAARQIVRMSTLRASGMVSTVALEDAEIRRNTAQSDLAAANTRVAQARQQMQRTVARAPFDGIVSDRKVSAGDTAQIGKELVKVIDPHSMRFEGLVSADHIGQIQAGQRVAFRVNGYGEQTFNGKVRRVNPSANETTRQVEVLVDFIDAKQQPALAGLYAEGKIETSSSAGLTVNPSALVREGDKTSVWRVQNNTLQKIDLVLGERDSRSGDFAIQSGVAQGDLLLRHPSATLKDGQKVDMPRAAGTGK